MISGGGITKTVNVSQVGIPATYIFQLLNYASNNQIFVSVGSNMEGSYLELSDGTIGEFTQSGAPDVIEAECPAELDCSVYLKPNEESSVGIEMVAVNAPFGFGYYEGTNIADFVKAMPEAAPNSGDVSWTLGHNYESSVTSSMVWDNVGTDWSRIILLIAQFCQNIKKYIHIRILLPDGVGTAQDLFPLSAYQLINSYAASSGGYLNVTWN